MFWISLPCPNYRLVFNLILRNIEADSWLRFYDQSPCVLFCDNDSMTLSHFIMLLHRQLIKQSQKLQRVRSFFRNISFSYRIYPKEKERDRDRERDWKMDSEKLLHLNLTFPHRIICNGGTFCAQLFRLHYVIFCYFFFSQLKNVSAIHLGLNKHYHRFCLYHENKDHRTSFVKMVVWKWW